MALLKNVSQSASSSGSVELLDDIEEDLVSLSLSRSLASSEPSFHRWNPAQYKMPSQQDLPRSVSCSAMNKVRRAPLVNPWSQSRDSGVLLSGSCPSVSDGVPVVVAELQAELQNRNETIRSLRECYVALLETNAHLEDRLNRSQPCTVCKSSRKLVISPRAVGTTQELQPRHVQPDMFQARSSTSLSPGSSPSSWSLPSGTALQDLNWFSASTESNVHSSMVVSCLTGSFEENRPKNKDRYKINGENINTETNSRDSNLEKLLKGVKADHHQPSSSPVQARSSCKGHAVHTSTCSASRHRPSPGHSSRGIQHETLMSGERWTCDKDDDVKRELLMCCLDAIHSAARTILQRSEATRSTLLHHCDSSAL